MTFPENCISPGFPVLPDSVGRHYINQWWLIINLICDMCLEVKLLKLLLQLYSQWVKIYLPADRQPWRPHHHPRPQTPHATHSAINKTTHIYNCCAKQLPVKTLQPSDTTWWHRSGSTLAQVMAWCLMAPCYYLNQCWLIIQSVLSHSPESNFTRSAHDTLISNICSEITISELLPHLPGANVFTHCGLVMLYGDIDLGQHWFR